MYQSIILGDSFMLTHMNTLFGRSCIEGWVECFSDCVGRKTVFLISECHVECLSLKMVTDERFPQQPFFYLLVGRATCTLNASGSELSSILYIHPLFTRTLNASGSELLSILYIHPLKGWWTEVVHTDYSKHICYAQNSIWG